MAKAAEFVQALRAAQTGVETVDETRTRNRDEWLDDLTVLADRIRSWLAPVVEAGLCEITERSFELNEPDYGEYTAPGLELHLVVAGKSQAVLVRPRGLRVAGVIEEDGKRIVGASGRLDLECGAARAILLRFRRKEPGEPASSEWVSYPNGEKRVIGEETFFELLARVTDLKVA